MKKYRVVYAMSYDVEAESENEALEKANEIFDKELERAIQESGCADCFGTNVEEL